MIRHILIKPLRFTLLRSAISNDVYYAHVCLNVIQTLYP